MPCIKVYIFWVGHYNLTKSPNFIWNYLIASKKTFCHIFVAFSDTWTLESSYLFRTKILFLYIYIVHVERYRFYNLNGLSRRLEVEWWHSSLCTWSLNVLYLISWISWSRTLTTSQKHIRNQNERKLQM